MTEQAPPFSRLLTALWQFFSRSFILLGLPLLAWGLDDLPGFFAIPVRFALAVLALAHALLHAVLIYQKEESTPRLPITFSRSFLHAELFEVILILSAFGDRRSVLTWAENSSVRWLGLGVYLLGWIYLLWMSGGTWSVRLRRYALVYLWITALGFALVMRSWTGLALTPVLGWVIINRLRTTSQERN